MKRACRKIPLDFDLVWAYWQDHDGRCEICGTKSPVGRGRHHLDHDHFLVTPEGHYHFRGILCGRCNTLLGQAREKTTILLAAIEYLKRSGLDGHAIGDMRSVAGLDFEMETS